MNGNHNDNKDILRESQGDLALYNTPITLWLIIQILLLSCSSKKDSTLFSLIPSSQSKVSFRNDLKENSEYNILNYLYFYNGGGVAVGDINNDGLSDIYFSSSMGDNKLYLNKGNFSFEDITNKAGVACSRGWKTGVSMADVNGDGYLDIYVCIAGSFFKEQTRNQLFINNQDNTFTDKAKEYGLDFQGLSTQAGFFDYDKDGDLDMYLLNHSVHSNKNYGDTSIRRTQSGEAGDRLFRNDEGKFLDVTLSTGIYSSSLGYGLGLAIGDINQDGWQDIYVSNDFHENDYLYYNNGDGSFTEGIGNSVGHTSRFSMGNDLADINNDGLLDLIVADMQPEDEKVIKVSDGAEPYDIYQFKLSFGYHPQFSRNTLQINTGIKVPLKKGKTEAMKFSEVGQLSGVSATDWSWSTLFADLDNDGLKDLFITNGIARRPNNLDFIKYISNNHVQKMLVSGFEDQHLKMIEQMPVDKIDNYAFMNRGHLSFKNVSEEWGLKKPSFSNGAAYADLDNDGDLDLVINNINDEAFIYRNNSENKGKNYLKVELKGLDKNTFGVGVKVIVKYKSNTFYQEQIPLHGFESSMEPKLNFGLGEISMVDSVIVIWNSGKSNVITRVRANQILIVEEKNAHKSYSFNPLNVYGAGLLKNISSEVRLDFKHKENKYNDFDRERLMPHLLSTQGPKIAVADINEDGLDDFFICGAKGQAGAIFIQSKDRSFQKLKIDALETDHLFEDVDAAFFDCDNDGDLDLFVASGGNEKEEFQNRLYLNQSNEESDILHFVKGVDNLPVVFSNASCVKVFDFDNDKDLDIFLGTRSIPGKYGYSPSCYLLENNGEGVFTDVTRLKAAEFSAIGMVTDAKYIDLNNDLQPELILVGEWMPITVFEVKNGSLRITQQYKNLKNTQGWWNCIEAGDFDKDGDMDLVTGNLGLNSIIKGSRKEPAELWAKDFDENGTVDPVITYYRQGESYPAASKDELLSQILPLKKKYVSYQSFAGQGMNDIFSREQLKDVVHKKVNVFESCYFENTGKGDFVIHPLPQEAQISPIYSLLIDDIDKDGNLDILTGGNLYGVGPYWGKYDAGHGLFLKGDGKGQFQAVKGVESGFVTTGEIRDIKKLRSPQQSFFIIGKNNEEVDVFE